MTDHSNSQLEYELPVEEQARADCYAILARLYYNPPDAGLLAAIAGAVDPEPGKDIFGSSWHDLAAAAAQVRPDAVRTEFDTLFVGTGLAEVTPYMTFYLVPTGRERVLVELRDELAGLGLARSASATEPEDHIAALFDVMRHLIVSDHENVALQEEKRFFNRYIRTGYRGLCDAIAASPNAAFYRRVAQFTGAFLDLESESFDLL